MNNKINYRIIYNIDRIVNEKGIDKTYVDRNIHIRLNQLKNEEHYPSLRKLIEWANVLEVDITELLRS